MACFEVTKMQVNKNTPYGNWRSGGPEEPSFTKEVVSKDFAQFGKMTTMDEISTWPTVGKNLEGRTFPLILK